MKLFSVIMSPGLVNRYAKVCSIIASIILLFSYLLVKSQSEDFKMTSTDETFEMELSVENREVKITLKLRDAGNYHHVIVEKTDDVKKDFRQCAYLELSRIAMNKGVVEITDKYPRLYNSSYYRIRLSDNEGIERVYPAVHLPAKEN